MKLEKKKLEMEPSFGHGDDQDPGDEEDYGLQADGERRNNTWEHTSYFLFFLHQQILRPENFTLKSA